MNRPVWKDHRRHAESLIAAATQAADPAAALRRHWPAREPFRGRVYLVSIGKASCAMLREAATLLARPFEAGFATVAPAEANAELPPGVERYVCDHPFPTARNIAAAEAMRRFLQRPMADDTLIVLVSGGGSAHLTLPAEGLFLEDIAEATRQIQRSGATIRELNAVRKHCEQLKGGRLAAACAAGDIRAFILSDVIGDPLDVISSGPTAPDPTTYADALAVMQRRGLAAVLPRVVTHLERGVRGEVAETIKPGDAALAGVRNTIIANNAAAVEAVAAAAETLGFTVRSVRMGVEGEAAACAEQFIALARGTRDHGACAWILGGETTVTVGAEARGIGGPSQEFALAAAERMRGGPDAVLVAYSTDGRDGPTDAAGAIVTHQTWEAIRSSGIDPGMALREHNSNGALAAAGAVIPWALTGTNLNHVAALLTY
ncbi:MAG: DUF4147 domain-containing protein [Planctomycetes bacterium]|nr:DUF4147 domain-containing protein [Planctomycetota bacterium]